MDMSDIEKCWVETNMKRKKIVMINCSYKEYSTGIIIESIVRNLSEYYEVYSFAEMGEREKFDKQHDFLISAHWLLWIHNKMAQIFGLYFWFGVFPTWKLIRKLRKIKPEILHLHCPNMGTLQLPMVLKYAAKDQIPVIMTNHCEVFYTSGCWHADECLAFVDGCRQCKQRKKNGKPDLVKVEWRILQSCYSNLKRHTMIAVSPWQRERMDIAKLAERARRVTILNGINTGIFEERKDAEQQAFCKNILGKSGRKYEHVILHVTASFSVEEKDQKGGKYLVSIAEKMKTVLFLVVGDYNIRNASILPENVRLMGYTANQKELSRYYSMADITLLTSKRETFGMVCAESLCCGTPVVGFRNGGSDSIADRRYSSFVPHGDVKRLIEEIEKWLDFKRYHPSIGEKERELYGMETMTEKYKKEYDLLLED